MKNKTTTTVLWITAIAATAYLTKEQATGMTNVIILTILAAVNVYLIKEEK